MVKEDKEIRLKNLYNQRYDLLKKQRLLDLNQGDRIKLKELEKEIDNLEAEAPKYDEIDKLMARTSQLCFKVAYEKSRELSAKLCKRSNEAQHTLSEIAQLNDMLNDLPESHVIERISLESRRNDREERLRKLGFEDQTIDQRKENLALNIALKDWPK